jgi:hypothetical protein
MNLIFIIIIVEMKNAKKFLRENSTESKAVAARIFNVNANSLISFIKRDSGQRNENHNKILQNHEINALDDFIRSLLKHEILPTSEIVFSAIVMKMILFLSKMRRRMRAKMPRMRDMVICVKIIQLMTNSTRGIFLMT